VDLPHPVPIEVRRQRNRILQQLSDRKNKLFRQSQIGRRLPAVTISDLGIALTTNYIRVELSQPTPARQLIEVELGPLSSRGMREASPLLVLDQ
ncbi:MAG: tRNA (N(6)-L-threonylcarbamoyladenosine(37)-C(2))-methylthiotransferase MtaB, partial [Acidobacteriota bacterium]